MVLHLIMLKVCEFTWSSRQKKNNFPKLEDSNVGNISLSLNDNSTRGHICKIQKPWCGKSFRQQTFPFCCIDGRNSLPEEILDRETGFSFKTKLDKHWSRKRLDLDQVYYY